jgi:lysophospholipase L1-like esterase
MAKANARYLPFYREEIRRICAERERIHCGPDLLELVTLGHLIDGLHPNARGDAVIGTAVAETLRVLAASARPARRHRRCRGATR